METLKTVLECAADVKYHDDLALLHKNLSVILRVISCTEKIRLEEFSQLTKDTSLLIARKYPWVEINYTLQRKRIRRIIGRGSREFQQVHQALCRALLTKNFFRCPAYGCSGTWVGAK